MDVYALSFDLISQRVNLQPSITPSSIVLKYCPAGWLRKPTRLWYHIQNNTSVVEGIITRLLSKYNLTTKIIHEDLEDSLADQHLTKWQWLRKRQLYKLYECNQLLPENTYDVVIRSRFELAPNVKVDVKQIVEQYDNIDNKVFLFGGWNCVEPMIFMDKYLCDGFAFGSQKSMNVFTSLYLEDAYPYDPKYEDCWLKYGDNVEYQFQEHLKANIEIVYIHQKSSLS